MSTPSTVLWPTPQVSNRKSRRALRPHALGGESSPPGLEQAVELAEGWTPREMPAPTVSNQLTLFAEAFPASRTPWLADVPAPATSATSGPSLSDSFASLNPDGSWRKTCQGYSQVTLDGSLARFSETWPRAGMTRNGIAYRRAPLAPLTGEIESGSWPTPSARDWKDTPGMATTGINPDGSMRDRVDQLARAVYAWPTPTTKANQGAPSMMKQGSACRNLREATNGGALSPTWVEWLMGFPLGWTACVVWETRLFRRSRNGSAGGL
jgi:hypothetical protein